MKAYHKWRGQSLRFGGTPQGWNEAARMSSGSSESAILDRVRTATRAVVAGEAAYERDSVLFDKADYTFALITALLRDAISEERRVGTRCVHKSRSGWLTDNQKKHNNRT